MGISISLTRGVWGLRERSYEEVLDMIEAYGYERILEDFYMDKVDVLLILDELGFISIEEYDDKSE
jgi:hypothetical protein